MKKGLRKLRVALILISSKKMFSLSLDASAGANFVPKNVFEFCLAQISFQNISPKNVFDLFLRKTLFFRLFYPIFRKHFENCFEFFENKNRSFFELLGNFFCSFRSSEKFSSNSLRRCDFFAPNFVKIRAILAIFRPFKDFQFLAVHYLFHTLTVENCDYLGGEGSNNKK